ncbi:MAG: phosphatidylglycerophosphatase A [Chitinophagaceae bacterium]|nr:phosphatidylglycerophosphatase A [Chitinophagaceae bacterium]
MKTIASIFGIGYVAKGGGTIAALVAAIIWYFLNPNIALQCSLAIVITIVGVWVGNKVEADWGKDSSKVVIDEVAGMFVSLLFVPIGFWHVLIGLVLFRFFDIAKPLGIRKMEAFKGGWGVMLDDVLAGIYANIILQIIVHTNVLEPYL